MKKEINYLFLIILNLIFLSQANANNTCPKKLIAFYSSDLTPYQFDVGNNPAGLDIAVLTAIFTKMNCKFDFSLSPFARSVKELESGSGDVILGLNKKIYEKMFLFSDPIYKKNYTLFTLTKSLRKYKIKKFEDIFKYSDFTIGITRGSYNGNIPEKFIKTKKYANHFEIIAGVENNLKKLLAGRIMGFIADYNNVSWLMKEQKITLDKFPIPLSSEEEDKYLYAAFSKKNITPQFLKKFNDNISKLKNAGKFKVLFEDFLSENEIKHTMILKK